MSIGDWEATLVGVSLLWEVSVWDDTVDCCLAMVESEAKVVLSELAELFSVVGWFVFWVVSVTGEVTLVDVSLF